MTMCCIFRKKYGRKRPLEKLWERERAEEIKRILMEDSGGANGDIVVRDIVRQGVEGRRRAMLLLESLLTSTVILQAFSVSSPAKRKEPSPYTTPSKRMMR